MNANPQAEASIPYESFEGARASFERNPLEQDVERPRRASERVRSLRRVAPLPQEIEGPSSRAMAIARAVLAHVKARPVASAGLAVGIGFLVGGALTFRAGRLALAAAARTITRELLKQVF